MAKWVTVAVGRRTFIVAGGTAAIGAGTYAWLRALGYEIDRVDGSRTGRPPTGALPHAPFDPLALAVLEVLVDQLIPGDSALKLPSAREVGVLDFLVRAAAAPGLLPVRNEILKLLRALDLAAKGHGGRFADLDAATRAKLLDEVARGEHGPKSFNAARALEATLRLSLEGYLGHPHHGGNRGAAVWDALAINMPRERAPHGHGHDAGG